MNKTTRPIKRLGQNFLKDKAVARKIVDSMNICRGDKVLEIGCGEGILTEYLIKSSAVRVYGVEIDTRLVQLLKEKFGDTSKFVLIEGDILGIDFSSMVSGGEKLRVVGNIPYNITSPILFHMLDWRSAINDFTIMVQKEVAERLRSSPGVKTYGVPSILFQMYGQIKILFSVSRRSFYPAPCVDSVVVNYKFFKDSRYELIDEDFFRLLVRNLFMHRRKMLKTTLRKFIGRGEPLEGLCVDLRLRPENLTVEQFASLSDQLFKTMGRENHG